MSKELNTLYSFKEQLSTAISGGGSEPSRFADLLIEKKLIDNSRAINILSTTGISCYDKTSRLISHVCSSIESCCEERSITVFSSFVEILRDPEKMGLKDLSEQLETHYNESYSDSGIDSPPSDTPCPCSRKDCFQNSLPIANGHDPYDDILAAELTAETKDMQDCFCDYGMAVYHFAKSEFALVESCLKQILELRGHSTCSSNFEVIYKQAKSGADFLNFEPLTCILKACITACCGCTKTSFQEVAEAAALEYENKFRRFAQCRVRTLTGHKIIPEILTTLGDHKELKLKIEEDFQRFPLNRIFYFKRVVRKILKIPEQVILRVASVQEGCVELTFQLHSFLNLELTVDQKKILASHKISMLTYDGKVEYCCCHLFNDEGSK